MYPPRNPFPAQATTIVEGASLNDVAQLTLARPPLDRLTDMVNRYFGAYDRIYNDNGKAIAVHGDHGSGKTHALAHAMLSLETAEPAPVWFIYVRADSPDIFSLYRKLLSQISLQRLQDLCKQARAQYAQEELAASRDLDSAAVQVALEAAGDGGDWVGEAFSAAELQATAVLDRQSSDLVREGMRQRDFERVIPSLLNHDLADAAYRWLTGEQLPPADLRALGITENIDSSLKIRMGILALLILSRRAGLPLTILIDQAESFITTADGSHDLDNVGTLRALLEGVLSNSGLLVVAIRESAWQALPPDLQQRFGLSEIHITGLTEREATDLVALYVSPWAEDEELRTYPFHSDGLREALVSSSGNIRRFLQMCSLLFTIAASDRRLIDRGFARNALSNIANQVPTRDTMRRQLTDLLAAAHAPYQVDYSLGSARADFVVRDAADGIRAFIIVSDAITDPQELNVAQRTLDLVQQTRKDAYPAEVVLVIGGYMSPELTSEIRKVHRVVIVTYETGQRDLEALVADLSAPSLATAGTEASGRLEELVAEVTDLARNGQEQSAFLNSQLHEAIQRLIDIGRDREQQWESLTPKINIWNQEVSDQRRSDDVAEAIREWHTLEEDLRGRIRSARAERQRVELDELERLRGKWERGRRIQLTLPGVLLLLAAVIVAIIMITQPNVIAATAWPVTGMLALVGIALPLILIWFHRNREGYLGDPVQSVGELTRLAYSHLQGKSATPGRAITLPLSGNPQIAYAAGLAPQNYPLLSLMRILARERSAIARRSLVGKLAADYGIDGFREVLNTIGGDPATSAAFDRLGTSTNPSSPSHELRALGSDVSDTPPYGFKGLLPEDIARNLTPELMMVARIYGFALQGRESDLLAEFIQTGLDDSRHKEHIRALRQSYDADDDRLLLKVLPRFTEREFRAAAMTLSPFNAGMVGTFDWLEKINEIDDLYLFFEKCLFNLVRGLPASPSST